MDRDDAPKPGVLWKGTISRSVNPVGSWEQAAPPIRGAELDQAVRDSVGAGIREWGDQGQRYAFVLIDPDCAKHPEFMTVGLDIRVELLRGDELLAEGWLVAANMDTLSVTNSISTAPVRFYGATNLNVEGSIDDTADWTLRLTGKADHMRYLWDAKKHWAGTITVPWSDAVAEEVERTGPSGRGPECSTPCWK